MSGSKGSRHGYSVQLRARRNDRNRELRLATMAPLPLTRARAEAAARAIGCPMQAEGIDGAVAASELDTPLAGRLLQRNPIRSKHRVQVTMQNGATRIATAPVGLNQRQWWQLAFVSLFLVLALGAIGLVDLSSNGPPNDRAIFRVLLLAVALMFWWMAMGRSILQATTRWLVDATPERLLLQRYVLGFWPHRWEIPANELEVVAVAKDTDVPLQEPSDAVLCVSDTTVVGLGHGLSKDELHTLRDAIVAGMQGTRVLETASLGS